MTREQVREELARVVPEDQVPQFSLKPCPQTTLYNHLILILIIYDQVKELVTCYSSPYSASEGSHAVVVCTEWDEFKTLDWKKVGRMQMMPISDDHDEWELLCYTTIATCIY